MNWFNRARLKTAGSIAVLFGLGLVAAHINTIVMTSDPDPFGWHGDDQEEHQSPTRDLHYIDVDVSGSKGGETYDQFDAVRDRSNFGNFAGFGCIESCKGPRPVRPGQPRRGSVTRPIAPGLAGAS